MPTTKSLVSKGTQSTLKGNQYPPQRGNPSSKAAPTAWNDDWRPGAASHNDGFTPVTRSKGKDYPSLGSRHNVYNPRGPQPSSQYGQSRHSGMPDIAGLEISNKGKRAPGTILEKRDYKAGMVFLTYQHEAKVEGMPLDSRYTTESQHGSICSKMRPMIVVALFDKHCVAVPLFTHNGRGMDGKKQDEFVSIKDARITGPFQALSKHKPLRTEYMLESANIIRPESMVQLTYPVCVRYGSRIIQQGSLAQDSLLQLVFLYNSALPKGKA
ncbi:MAG: hypothetical protein M1812_007697 [Candelaria pacifica]|nr:MAG: hypothetical protein M1812_007697 [Candelaria pacifica]